MKKLLEKLFGSHRERISRERALQVAKTECDRQGWAWTEPIHLDERPKYVVVWTNTRSRGSNAAIKIDAFDGSIIKAWMVPY